MCIQSLCIQSTRHPEEQILHQLHNPYLVTPQSDEFLAVHLLKHGLLLQSQSVLWKPLQEI
jgi:hypothetical protein